MTKLRAIAAGILLGLCGAAANAGPLSEVTYNFSWEGGLGYSLRGSFAYDADALVDPVIRVGNPVFELPVPRGGAGPVPPLTSLSVAFFNPDGDLTQSFDTVAGGVSESEFFAFQFDTVSATVVADSYFNVGGGAIVAGTQFFSGINGAGLSLFEHTITGGDGAPIVLDGTGFGGDAFITIERMPPPQPASAPGSLSLALLALGLLRMRRAHAG